MSLSEISFDVIREMNEFRNQLSLIKRIGFFFGAGTSMSLGISGIKVLTEKVEQNLGDKEKKIYLQIKESLKVHLESSEITIEDILNQLRLIRQITRNNEKKDYEGINGKIAKHLDAEICNSIYKVISEEAKSIDLTIMKQLMSWINWLSRDFTKELFTTNYDLIFEKAMESLQIPYFDGFVGANEPFFLPESIECNTHEEFPPLSWIRLWKLHGSFGWFWRKNSAGEHQRVVRLGELANCSKVENDELVIYPSREKYELSRKQPFIAYFDRLKRYLNEKEGLFIISGYSFSDEHINEIFFNSLKQNNRLHIIAFLYSNDDMAKLQICGCNSYLNFTAFGPDEAIIGGNFGKWNIDEKIIKEEPLKVLSFWNIQKKHFKLGDFKEMVSFLIEICGKKVIVEKEIAVLK